jgi:hypothetical protein
MIRESDSANGGDEQQEGIVNIGLGGVWNKFVWKNVGLFPV